MLSYLDWFDAGRFMPHGLCLAWDPGLLSLTAGSDAIIAFSYYSIPIAMLYYASKRDDMILKPVLLLFVSFILACGTTHIMDIWTLWDPDYGAAALAKTVTAVASLTTVIVVWRVMPIALTIPSPHQLARVNAQLAVETQGHRTARIQAEELAAQFEARVLERTAELEQKTSELLKTNTIMMAVMEAGTRGAVVLNADHLVTIWNPLAEKIHNLSAAEAIGKPYPGLPGVAERPEDPDPAALCLQGAAEILPTSVKLRRRQPDGKVMDLEFSAIALHSPDQQKMGLLFVIDDVTERNLLDARLRQSQKMEAIGQMTGGVAHDFNNLLAVILGNLELLEDERTNPSDHAVLLREALGATRRGAQLTRQLLAYSRQQPLEPRSVDIPHLVTDLAGLLQRTLGETISIGVKMADNLWPARIDPNQLENALLNLAINARDAMPDGGRLTIEAENVVLDPQPGDDLAEIIPGPYVLMVVSDTGVGMTAEVRERVLEPFFTTKPVGAGSGLGLSMVYGFVKQSGGHIKIYSEPGHGTSVRLYLPRDHRAVDTMPEKPPEPLSSGGETILLVEDDSAVGKLTMRMLEGFGYQTLTARDARAALELLERTPHVSLLMSDVMLPNGMNGAVLGREAKRRRPDLKIMLISGYTRDIILHNGSVDEGIHFLAKPFPRAELARKVREVLDEV
jgi:PAS domain S-box-containing protein